MLTDAKSSLIGKRTFSQGSMVMDQKELEYLRRIEDHAAQTGWVAPLTQEDKDYFAYLRQVSKRYNINLSKTNRLEYDFVTRVAESEFYLQRANTEQSE